MNIYVCSTVRHLLFALCRANHEVQEQHHILFFADYQDASLSDWSFSQLPSNIRVYEISRSDLRGTLKKVRFGWISYLFAMRGLPAPDWVKKPIRKTLTIISPSLAASLNNAAHVRLWVFNEHNKMARIFRLLTSQFSDIEEGHWNYMEQQLPWWKAPVRILRGLPPGYRVLGEDPRCEEIWVNHPELLPSLVRGKGKMIDFLDGPNIPNFVAKIFGQKLFLTDAGNDTVILATQPFEGAAGLELEDKQRIYGQIVDYLKQRGKKTILKIHPGENATDYEFLADRTTSTPSKLPLEALILGTHQPILVISIFSTAGLGFEQFCHPLKLCDGDRKTTLQLLQLWGEQPEALGTALENKLGKLPK